LTALLFVFLAFAMMQVAPAAGAAAGEHLQVDYVYSEQCLNCQHAWPAVMQAVDAAPAPVNLTRHEITTKEGNEYARAHGITSVPAAVVNCGPPMQLEDYDGVDSFVAGLRDRMACEAGTDPCHGLARHSCVAEKSPARLSAPAAFMAGLVAGINPCLLAVMAFIAGTTLSAAGGRMGIFARIAAFCGGLLAVYLLIGLGLIGLMGRVPGLDAALKIAVIGLLVLMAAWSLFDAYRTSRGAESRSFKAVVGLARPLYRKYGVPASFLIGAAFGLVKMPCVGGLYIAILGTILQAGRALEGVGYLIIYNAGVVAPVLALGLLLALGLSPERVNAFRLKHRVKLKTFTGLLLAAMAAGFALGII